MIDHGYRSPTPEELAAKVRQEENKTVERDTEPSTTIATPWWRDPKDIPKRNFLYGGHYIRAEIVASIGAGGRCKTTLNVCEAVSMATGRNLMTGASLPEGPLRVWVINAEEDQDELDRRFAAACQHYGLQQADLDGRLFVESIRAHPWRIATIIEGIPTINEAVVGKMKDFITRNRIDVFTIDPFVSFHAVNENSNGEMDMVIKEGFGAVASATNSACGIFHHPGKPKPGQETTVEDGRGASAIIWAVRLARVLNFMNPEEAKKLGIAEDLRRRHIRIANGKANMGPLGGADWMKIEVENLPNGDQVACATAWKPPDPFQGISSKDVEVAQQLAQSGQYRVDSQSPMWFGFAIAPRLKIDVRYRGDNASLDLARLKTIIKVWLKNQVLAIEEREAEGRKMRKFIVSGPIDLSGGGGNARDESCD